MNTLKLLATSVIFAVIIRGTADVQAQTTYQWNGPTDTNWSNTANWSGGGVAATNGTSNARLNVYNAAANPLYYTAAEGYTIYTNSSSRGLVIASGINGAMTIGGGTFESRGYYPDLIASGGYVGSLTIDGGSYINTNANGSQELIMGYTGANNATLNINSGSAFVDLVTFENAAYQTGTNTINLNGGVLSTVGIAFSPLNLPSSVIATVNFNGGTLQALGSAGSFGQITGISNTINVTAVNVMAGGAIIDSQSFTTSTTNAFLHAGSGLDGGLTKFGSGTLTLSGPNTYNGSTLICNGTLNLTTASTGGGTFTNFSGTTLEVTAVTGGQSLAMAALTLSNQCTIDFNDGGLGNPANPVINAINLFVQGTNQVNLIGATFSRGQFTLIKYNTASGVTNGSFVASSLPAGVTAYISNNVANASIDLVITHAIPASALNDPLYGLGYLVVTHYAGVTNDGSGDCTVGIQSALNDAYAANQVFQSSFFNESANTNYVRPFTNRPVAVFFPPGIYQISNTLECYEWTDSNSTPKYGFDSLIGSTAGAARPKIVLAAGAANFQSTNAPRQMISFRNFKGLDGSPVPVPNPMSAPTNYSDWGAGNMNGPELRNLDFDCNGNPGAVGVVFTGAQGCSLENVKVSATNALAGFYMLPGAGAYAANLEVDGGQYGIIHGRYSSLGLTIAAADSGPTVVGVTLANQTVSALKCFDEDAPVTVVGFNITNCANIAVQTVNYYSTSDGTLTLLDGQISVTSSNNPAAIDNSVGNNIYVRNVYVSGTTNLIKSGNSTTTGAGTWPLVSEYAYNDQVDVAGVPPNTNYAVNTVFLESYSLINGTVQNLTVPFPVSPMVVSNNSMPPSNLLSQHLWAAFPSYNGATNDPPTVVVSTNAGWNNANDSTALLQAAIDAAHTNNGRVFLPAGLYYITNTLTLYTNTVLLGVGRQLSCIQASMAWRPASGEATMVQTMDSPSATTTLAYLSLATRKIWQQADTNYSRFNALTWQAGSNSLVLAVDPVEFYTWLPNSQARSIIIYTNYGGGQWYGMCLAGTTGEVNPGFRKVKVSGTTQPLWFYGFNLEHGAGDMEVELSGASNVRMLGLKREGSNPLLVISNCANVAAYGFGRAVSSPTGNGYFQVLGASTNILLANLTVYAPATKPGLTANMLYEGISGYAATNILWPNLVSLYKRGEIDDTQMFSSILSQKTATAQSVPASDIQIAPSGGRIIISWLSGGSLQSADQVSGPYYTVVGATNPYSVNFTTNGSMFFRIVK